MTAAPFHRLMLLLCRFFSSPCSSIVLTGTAWSVSRRAVCFAQSRHNVEWRKVEEILSHGYATETDNTVYTVLYAVFS
eukprot:scaffold1947_cov106-Cylindrotheca_fusiformis.AAC.3